MITSSSAVGTPSDHLVASVQLPLTAPTQLLTAGASRSSKRSSISGRRGQRDFRLAVLKLRPDPNKREKTGSFTSGAPRKRVWSLLRRPEVPLGRCWRFPVGPNGGPDNFFRVFWEAHGIPAGNGNLWRPNDEGRIGGSFTFGSLANRHKRGAGTLQPPAAGPGPHDDGEAYVAGARAGSPEDLGRILDQARNYLLGVANRELQSVLQAKVGASDLVQETFLEAQRAFHHFAGQSQSDLLAWLRGILLNKLAELSRRYQRTAKRLVDRERSLEDMANAGQAGIPPQAAPSPSSIVSLQEQCDNVRQALQRLPEHYRQVLEWREWEGLPFEEIAGRMAKSADAVRMLWYRAIERLQEELGQTP